MEPQPRQRNLYEQDGAAGRQWAGDESSRLANMDSFFQLFAREDLDPVFADVAARYPDQPAQLLDIGAGTGMVTESLCAEQNVAYFALDVNQELLAGRTTETTHKILGSAEATNLPENSFDITFSRAVTAWNADPKAAIAEQLRVTRLGGYAVFTEFDWTDAGAVSETEVTATTMATKAIMMEALTLAGFKPEYGKQLGSDVSEVVRAAGLRGEQFTARHELPAGDYREILLEGAETICAQLDQFKHGQPAAMAAMLRTNIAHIRSAETFSFRLPALVTRIVRLAEVQQDEAETQTEVTHKIA